MRRGTRSRLQAVGLAVAGLALAGRAAAQAIEPRAYSPAPVGLNFVIAGWAATQGGLSFDPSIPVENPKLSTSGPVLAYARTLDIFGQSGKFDVIVPSARLTGSAIFGGVPVSREVEGFADPSFRVSVSLFGAPAMTARQFGAYRQDLIVGASLQVSVPVGQYDPDRLVNLGAHRWSAKPEVGVSKAFGAWTVEGDGAVTLFSDNDDFFGGLRRARIEADLFRARPAWFTASALGFGPPWTPPISRAAAAA